MLTVVALAGTATVSDRPVLAQTAAPPPVPSSPTHPCHLLTSTQSIPGGFGAAYNLFSAAKELLIEVDCGSSSDATLTVGNGQNTTYIYRFGYEWTGSEWKQIAFGGTQLAGNDWYVGTAKAELLRSQQQLARDNFLVAYTCLWHNKSWKCGCQHEACSQNYWQLQVFNSGRQSTDGWDEIPAMKLHWSWTPKPGDEGKTGDAAGYWFQPPNVPEQYWNDDTLNPGPWWQSGGKYKISRAPTGDLAFEILAPKGVDGGVSNIRLLLWPNDANKSPTVWRLRYLMFIEQNHYAADGARKAGEKIPGGMIYGRGARSGGRNWSPKCPSGKYSSWAEFSATMRLISKIDTNWALYTYDVPDPNDPCKARETFSSSKKMEVGRWLAMELEYKNQSAAGKADGYQKLWIDGQLVTEGRNILWVAPHIPPQGFRGAWFEWYYGGSAQEYVEDTRIWLRDIEIWVK